MGKPRNTRKYPKYLEIPESKKDTRKYPIVYLDTPTRPATRYFVQYPTRPDPILKNPTRWALPETLQHHKDASKPHMSHQTMKIETAKPIK